ncbi:MAG: Gfo/Idh/MocA family oxidoreductase [Bacteroidales bacterium]|nr:Gfo/Idh/MocA family oxidoreductase [Bacteroidales bacterium]
MERRRFLGNLSIGFAGFGIAGACSGNASGKTNPTALLNNAKEPGYRRLKPINTGITLGANNKVQLALIGAGNWGTVLAMNAIKLNKNISIKYICDVDDTRGGMAISEITKKQGQSPIRVRDMRRVFEDKEVDGVIIATPQHWHALACIWAMQAGKDVYVEKCVSFTIAEGQKMIEAAVKYGRVLQCGTQTGVPFTTLRPKNTLKAANWEILLPLILWNLMKGRYPSGRRKPQIRLIA